MLLAASACGRFGFDATDDRDAAPADAMAQAPPDFSNAAEVTALNEPGSSSDDATLTADLLEIYFTSRRPGGLGADDIYRSERPSLDAVWEPPSLLAALSSAEGESTLALSSNGLFLLFGSRRAEPEQDLYLASRPDRQSDFQPPRQLTELSSAQNESASWVSDDGLTLWFHSSRDGDFDVYRATRSRTDLLFDEPMPIDGMATPGAETTATRNIEAFALLTYRMDGDDQDLFSLPRLGEAVYGPRSPLVGVNTDGIEGDPWLAPDGCTLFFSRHVEGLAQLFTAECLP